MKIVATINRRLVLRIAAILLIIPGLSVAQVPVDDDGNVLGSYEPQTDSAGNHSAGSNAWTAKELQELVGPVALYPDDLLAIVLPASAYPLQIAAAARFVKALENDSNLKPNPDWDDSVVALTNYPEILELMNEDLDWTYRLGEAVVAQQADVVAAVEAFRDRAYAAGNLKSDEYQTVSHDDGVIEISPVAEDVIYVPYYEPRRVVVYQPRPAYYYHPRAYPVYYYPYAAHHYFNRGYFWGVTTAFSIGWYSDSLHVFHHSYHGHPYYGHDYYRHHWYRRPSISIYNSYYGGRRTQGRHVNNREGYANRYRDGDRWQARDNRRVLTRRRAVTRTAQTDQGRINQGRTIVATRDNREPIRFRERDSRPQDRTAAIARNERRSTNLVGNTSGGDTSRRRAARTRGGDRQDDESRDFTFRERNRARSDDANRTRRGVVSRDTRRSNVDSQSRQRQSDQGRVRVNTSRRDGTAERRPAPVKRAGPRQEQPPRAAAEPRRQERSGNAEPRQSRNKDKRESRSRDRRR